MDETYFNLIKELDEHHQKEVDKLQKEYELIGEQIEVLRKKQHIISELRDSLEVVHDELKDQILKNEAIKRMQ